MGGQGGSTGGGTVSNTFKLVVNSSSFGSNSVTGGAGGTEVNGVKGGTGGWAYGAAIDDEGYLNSGSFVGGDLTVSSNRAIGGAGGASPAGAGGDAGTAFGGGIFSYETDSNGSQGQHLQPEHGHRWRRRCRRFTRQRR